MYRKLYEPEGYNKFFQSNDNYGSTKPLKNNNILDGVWEPSYASKNQLSNNISQSKKGHRGHSRNYSDFVTTPQRNQNQKTVDIQQNKQNKITILEARIFRVQQKLKQSQLIMKDFRFNNGVDIKVFQENKRQTENRIFDVSSVIHELKQKIQKINNFLMEGPTNQFTFRSYLTSPSTQYSKGNMDKFVDKITEINQALIETVRKEFKQKINELNQKVKILTINKPFEQACNYQNEFFKTNRKYSGNPITFIYQQYLKKSQRPQKLQKLRKSQKQNFQADKICFNQITYFIDLDGFLLDQTGCYLVNNQMKQIKLSEKQLKLLKRNKILMEQQY